MKMGLDAHKKNEKAHDQKPYLPYITDKMAHTVREAMVTCGLNDVDLFDNKTAAERFAKMYLAMILTFA